MPFSRALIPLPFGAKGSERKRDAAGDIIGEWFDSIFNSEELDTFAGFALIFGIGAFFCIMNWAIFFNNLNPKKKWVSMAPPLGGLLTAVGILLIGGGWWALLGLTDPWIWMLVYSLMKEFVSGNNKKDDVNKNGD